MNAVVGYGTIGGGSWETITKHRTYAKSVQVDADCWLLWIETTLPRATGLIVDDQEGVIALTTWRMGVRRRVARFLRRRRRIVVPLTAPLRTGRSYTIEALPHERAQAMYGGTFMADTLTTIERAPVLLDDDTPVGFPGYSLAPCADESVAHANHDGSNNYVIEGVAPGTTTYTVTRTVDGATATGTVTVVAAGDTFSVHLGTPVPR